MNPLLLYLLKASISLSIFYGVYMLSNKREVFFNFNRVFLLSALFFASLLPLFSFDFFHFFGVRPQSSGDILYYAQLPSIQINEVVIKAESTSARGFSMISLLTAIYLIVVAFKSLQLIFKFYQISILSKKYKSILIDGIRYIQTADNLPVFSFFNRIFINEQSVKSEDTEKIIEHEKVHINQLHSVDLLVAEIVCIFQWFNPFAYFLKREIRENHEFIADRQMVVNQSNEADYRLLLLENASQIKTN